MKLAATRWLAAVAATFPLLCAFSCDVPLGPGYHIEKESIELTLVTQPQPLLHLLGRYRLENTGNSPLSSLDVTVPEKDVLGRENLHILVDGKDASITEQFSSGGTMDMARISFQPAWRPHQKKEIEIACDFAGGLNMRAWLTANAFAFDGAYWFPAFQTPGRPFAKGEGRAALTDISIGLPRDFLAVASGQQTARKVHGDTAEYRFRLRNQDDSPYVIAGRYKQQFARNKGTTVYFWTFQGLPDNAVKTGGEQLAAAAQFFDSTFVAHSRGESLMRVVEIPERSGPQAIPSDSLPGTILLDKESLSETIGRRPVTPDEIGWLSDTWLRWMAFPDTRGTILPASLRNYARDVFYESRQGSPYRRMKIGEYLGQYDQLRGRADEKPIVLVTHGDSVDQVNMAVNKGTLFLYALEDACGTSAFRRGMGQMVSSLRGREYDYADMRAALSDECTRSGDHPDNRVDNQTSAAPNIDALFRTWLYGTGIPAEFRERYPITAVQQVKK